jgi:hypothetical protein
MAVIPSPPQARSAARKTAPPTTTAAAALLLLAAAAAPRGAAGARVPGSPYPVPGRGLNCSGGLYTFDPRGASADDVYAAQTAQGVLSRACPGVMRVDPTGAYGLWANHTAAVWGVPLNASLGGSLAALLAAHRGAFAGYVLVDLADNSTASGVAAAAALGALGVTPANEGVAVAAGLRRLYDLRGTDTDWVLAHLNGTAASANFTFSRSVSVLQSPLKAANMGDYAIAAGALQWWADAVAGGPPLVGRVLGALDPPYAVLGWGPDELGTVTTVSGGGGWVVGADWASNLDVLSGFDVPGLAQRPAPTPAAAPAPAPPVHTVCFLMTDGDNVQWMLDAFATGPAWWGSPDRGAVPMGWTVSPSLADLAPVVPHYLYATASTAPRGRDVFVAGASGGGYFYPDAVPSPGALADLTALTAGYMAKAGLRIVNVLGAGTGYAPPVAGAYTAHAGVDAVLWYDYADYSGLRGSIGWSNGKPVVGGRFNLWGDGSNPAGPTFKNVTGLVAALLGQARDPSSAAGYSLVPVHAWSHNVSDARAVADALAAALPGGGVDVVPPDEFVARIVANVKR